MCGLSRPKLTDLPENPVGKILEQLRVAFPGYSEVELPEIVDFAEARKTIETPYYDDGQVTVYNADCLSALPNIAAAASSISCPFPSSMADRSSTSSWNG